jgi:hypothetical protein
MQQEGTRRSSGRRIERRHGSARVAAQDADLLLERFLNAMPGDDTEHSWAESEVIMCAGTEVRFRRSSGLE